MNPEIFFTRCIGFRVVDMTSTSDQEILLTSADYIVRRVTVCNASGNVSVAVGGIYTQPNKGGTAVVPATQNYLDLTDSFGVQDAAVDSTVKHLASNLYFSLTTGAVSGTATVFIYADKLDV
jgi:hypothetical protein